MSGAEAIPEGCVLVTGGAGYVGSHTVRLLQQRGVQVVVFDNLSTGHRAACSAPLVVGDLGDPAALREVFARHRPRAVLHFAAKCYVGESARDPARYYRENVVHSWNLLEAMRAAGCRELVFSSSCATYGVPEEFPITEDHPQRPISPYGRTKHHVEQMIEDYGKAYGLVHAALRYFNAAGASASGDLGEHHDPETHLIPIALQVALGQRPRLEIYGDDYDTTDGTCVRDYVHVDDLADAHCRALSALQNGAPAFACNLGSGSGFSVRQVLEVARKVTKHPIPAQVGPRRPGDPARLVSGGDRARSLLGWLPQRTSLDEIVGDAWRFQSAHPSGFEE